MKKLFIILGLALFISTAFTTKANAYTTEGAMHYNEGLDFYTKGEYSKAIQSFKVAVEKDPDFIDAYYNMGSLYEFMKSYNSAIACFSKIHQLDPNDSENTIKLAELYHRVGNTERSLFYLSKIKDSDEQYGRAKNLKNQIVLASQKAAAKNALTTNNTAIAANKTIINKFAGPTGLAMNSEGVLFVASYSENCIYKIYPNGQTQMFTKNPQLGGPIGLAFDAMDNLYVANYAKNNILKINKAGQVFTFMQNITNPYYLFIKDNNLFISEQGSNTVVKYKLY